MKNIAILTISAVLLLLVGSRLEGATAGIIGKLMMTVSIVALGSVVKAAFFQHRPNRFYYRLEIHSA